MGRGGGKGGRRGSWSALCSSATAGVCRPKVGMVESLAAQCLSLRCSAKICAFLSSGCGVPFSERQSFFELKPFLVLLMLS